MALCQDLHVGSEAHCFFKLCDAFPYALRRNRMCRSYRSNLFGVPIARGHCQDEPDAGSKPSTCTCGLCFSPWFVAMWLCKKICNPPEVLRMLANVPIVPQAPCRRCPLAVAMLCHGGWGRSSTARVPRPPCPSWSWSFCRSRHSSPSSEGSVCFALCLGGLHAGCPLPGDGGLQSEGTKNCYSEHKPRQCWSWKQQRLDTHFSWVAFYNCSREDEGKYCATGPSGMDACHQRQVGLSRR